MMRKVGAIRHTIHRRPAVAARLWTIALGCICALSWYLPKVDAADKTVHHIVGTVTAIDHKRLVVQTFKGSTVSIKLTKQVRFKNKTDPQSNRPPAVGDRVIVEATRDRKTLTATIVHYSPMSQPPEPPE